MVDVGGSVSPRKRRLSDTSTSLRRIRALSFAAAPNLPEPRYLDPSHASSGRFQLITERQREKVVKYINEVSPPARRGACSLCRPPPRFRSRPLAHPARLTLASPQNAVPPNFAICPWGLSCCGVCSWRRTLSSAYRPAGWRATTLTATPPR